MSRASKIYITWPFNIQIAEINLNQNTTKRFFHAVSILTKCDLNVFLIYS